MSPVWMLVLVNLLWGLSFPLVKTWQHAASAGGVGPVLASLTFMALRMTLALLLLRVCLPGLFVSRSRLEVRAGYILGSVFAAGLFLQVLGMTWATPALSAFITSLASAWVPVIAFFWMGIRASLLTLIGLGLGLAGVAALARVDATEGIIVGWGEILTLGSTLLFAVQILLLDHYGRRLNAARLTPGLFLAAAGGAWPAALILAAAGPGLGSWWAWTLNMLSQPAVLWGAVLLNALVAVLTFWWMNLYQPRIAAARAALIYLLEPVFASLISVCLGWDQVDQALLVGGGLILGGNLLVELPRVLGRRGKGLRLQLSPCPPSDSGEE